jgi:hypothetical protein
LQHDSVLLAVQAFPDHVPLQTQHGQSSDRPRDSIYPLPHDALWNWLGDLPDTEFPLALEGDRQLLSSQPKGLIDYELEGVPTVDELESVHVNSLGPHYQEPSYEEFTANRSFDLFKNWAYTDKFDTVDSLSPWYLKPLADSSELIAASPEFPGSSGGGTYSTASNVLGFSIPTSFSSQNILSDVEGAWEQW